MEMAVADFHMVRIRLQSSNIWKMWWKRETVFIMLFCCCIQWCDHPSQTPQTQQLRMHGVFDELGKSDVPPHAARCFPPQYGCYILSYVYLYSWKQSAWADAQRVSTSPFLCEFGSVASEKGEGNGKICLKKAIHFAKVLEVDSKWTIEWNSCSRSRCFPLVESHVASYLFCFQFVTSISSTSYYSHVVVRCLDQRLPTKLASFICCKYLTETHLIRFFLCHFQLS